MAPRTEALRNEIERAKADVARDLGELRQEAAVLGRRIVRLMGVAVAVYVGFRVLRAARRRARR